MARRCGWTAARSTSRSTSARGPPTPRRIRSRMRSGRRWTGERRGPGARVCSHPMTRGNAPLRRYLLLLPLSLPLLATACTSEPPGWLKVGGPLYNVGGMAYVGEDAIRGGEQFVVVHDNKKPDEPRVGLVTLRRGKARYQKLRWPRGTAPTPVDLESVSSVPDAPHRFLALESSGRLFHLRYEGGDAVEVLHVTRLPDVPQVANFEGFCVEKIDGRLIAAWAHRGQGDEPAVLFWGTYDLPADTIT